jgi:hypothetical protein
MKLIIGIMLATFVSSDAIKPPVYPLKWGCDNFRVNDVDFSFPGCEVEFEGKLRPFHSEAG